MNESITGLFLQNGFHTHSAAHRIALDPACTGIFRYNLTNLNETLIKGHEIVTLVNFIRVLIRYFNLHSPCPRFEG